MHVDHELVEFMPVDEQDYEEVIGVRGGDPRVGGSPGAFWC